jgi:hypothetical protein
MGKGLGVLTLSLVTRIGGFTGPLDKASRTADKRMKEIERRANKFGLALGASLVAAGTAAGYAIKQAIDQADELGKISQKIGVPTDVLSGLNYAAKLAGVATEELQNGLVRLTRFQADAAQGGKDSSRVFEALGIAVKDAGGNLRSTSELFQDFAQVFATLKDGPEKTALAVKVFGKSGADLIPLLNSGRTGLAAYAAELDSLGGTVTPEAARQAEEFNDNIERLKVGVGGLALTAARDLLPPLIEITQWLGDAAKSTNSAASAASKGKDDFLSLADSIKLIRIELDFLSQAWDEQGLFGEGIFSVLRRAREEFDKQKATMEAYGLSQANLGAPGNAGGRGVASARAAGRADRAARSLYTPEASRASSKAISDAAREAARAQEELNRKFREAEEASGDFRRQVEDLAAQMGGPLAESQLRYKREEEALRDLWARSTTPVAGELEDAITKLHAARDADAEAIRKSLDTGEQQLKQMREELDLLNLQTQAARDRAAFLLDNPTATGAQADAAAALRAQIDETREAIAAADELRGSFADAFASVLDGSKSAKDAFTDLADSIIAQMARMLAQNWTEQLFGQFGTTGAGSTGGGFLSVLSGFLGGARADGGPVSANVPYLVGERGPEIVVPRAAGAVVPNHKLGGVSVTNQITVSGNASKETADQIAMRVAMATQRALVRSA